MVSLKDIAARTATSVSTVSLVLNDRAAAARISEATQAHVWEAARALGYTPNMAARRLRAGQAGVHALVIGVLLPLDERLAITAPAVGAIHRALDDWRREADVPPAEVMIEAYPGGQLAGVASLRHNARYTGAILFNTLPEDDDWLAAHGPLPIPVVVMQRSVAGHNWVNTDGAAMGAAVAAHLLAGGRTRFAVVTPAIASAAQSARVEGFATRLQAAPGGGTAPHSEERGAFSEAGGYAAATRLLARCHERSEPMPDAWFVTTDRMAVGVLHALKRAGGRVPADAAVVGYDNDPVAAFTDPPLTTVDASVRQSAAHAATMLVDLIHGRVVEPVTALLDARLVVRESSGGGADSRGR